MCCLQNNRLEKGWVIMCFSELEKLGIKKEILPIGNLNYKKQVKKKNNYFKYCIIDRN